MPLSLRGPFSPALTPRRGTTPPVANGAPESIGGTGAADGSGPSGPAPADGTAAAAPSVTPPTKARRLTADRRGLWGGSGMRDGSCGPAGTAPFYPVGAAGATGLRASGPGRAPSHTRSRNSVH